MKAVGNKESCTHIGLCITIFEGLKNNKEWYIHHLTYLCICYVNIFYECGNRFYRCILSGQVFCSYVNQKYIKCKLWKIKVKICNICVHEQKNSKQIWINKKKGLRWKKKNMTWKRDCWPVVLSVDGFVPLRQSFNPLLQIISSPLLDS